MTTDGTRDDEAGLRDWTTGHPAVTFQRCARCGAAWYFRRALCPACGTADPVTVAASGAGVVVATTVVSRAPTPELRHLAPYRVALVDMAEGFRMMTHAPIGTQATGGKEEIAIGDPVSVKFHDFGGRPMPIAMTLAHKSPQAGGERVPAGIGASR